jgi:anti-sigma factor RsiW
MPTIHEQIDELLAADLHGELSAAERDAFHAHLVDCAGCRHAFQEEKNMHKLLNETLADKKADTGFEQRMVARFRDRVPQRPGLVQLVMNLVRLRAVQLTAVAALLLSMVQMGRMITGESMTPTVRREDTRTRAESDLSKSAPDARRDSGVLAYKTDAPGRGVDQLAASHSTTVAGMVAQNPAPPPAQDKAESETPLPVTVYSAEVLHRQASTAPKTKKNETKDEKPSAESTAEFTEESPSTTASATANRKLVRNATAELEVAGFEEAVQKITGFAAEEKGYVSTSSSEKQANGKLSGQVVVKVLPDNLDKFLLKLRGLGELKNQALTTEDVTKQYFDTESRMKNARLMEQRLIEILKTKSKDVADLLEVEKELGRVREEIETMQGELKFMDSQVNFATVTIQLSEKNMNVPAAFLLKERAQLALYAPEVEKTYNDIKALASPKVQITNAQINRDNTGRVSGYVHMLIAPEESEAIISRVKGMARVENFQVQTERVAQGGDGLGESAKTERDKVVLNITISREEQEQALQQTTLRIRATDVNDKTKQLRELAEKQTGRVRSSSFLRDPNGRESANVSLRVPMKNYNALMESLNTLGKVENVSIQRNDRPDAQASQADAPADITIQVYSQGNIVSQETGIMATLRRTIGQGAAALMWSARMIGVALAFLAPWGLALVGLGWAMRRISRARRAKQQRAEEEGGLS